MSTFPEPDVRYGERLLPHIVDEEAVKRPDRVLAMMPKSSNISDGWIRVNAKQLADSINLACWWIEEQIGKPKTIETIAYLGPNDFRYWIIEIAACKVGYCTLLLSPRNSTINNIAVLDKTNCKTIVYTADKASIVENIRQESDAYKSVRMLGWEKLMETPSKPMYAYNKTWETAKKDPVVIVHTSGSTGSPKPVYYTHEFISTCDLETFLPDVDGRKASGQNLYADFGLSFLVASPMFHLSGFHSGLVPLLAGPTMVLPPTDVPANASMILDIMAEVDIQTIGLPPTIFEEMVSDYPEEFMERSNKLEYVVYGGGPLAPSTGEWLSERFHLMNGIGSSETSKYLTMVPAREDWEYFEWHPTHFGHRMEPIGEDNDVCELTIHRDPKLAAYQAVFTTQPDVDVWRTRDLFQKHPTKEMWRFKGRRDDVIVLANGEKFNPVTMEQIILGHPKVSGTLVVGLRRPQCAVLLETRDKAAGNAIIEDVWPMIERANSVSPGHAQIARNMVLVISPDKPFPRAGKGTILREIATRTYETDIDALYENAELSAGNVVDLPTLDYTPDNRITQFVRQLVALQLKDKHIPADGDDLFVAGFDSLQTTQLATNLRASLKMQIRDWRQIAPKLIYSNPSITKIAGALQAILDSEATGIDRHNSNKVNGTNGALDPVTTEVTAKAEAARTSAMKALITKFSSHLPKEQIANGRHKSKDRGGALNVLVTGTTGSLGHYLVEALVADENVNHIYCFNRASDADKKFAHRTTSGKIDNRLEFLQVTFGDEGFGLPDETFTRLKQDVDIIVHNAWKVDFNHSLESFVDVHLRGVDNFIQWCLASPRQPSIYFVSSVSSMGAWHSIHKESVPERVSDECRVAAPVGYGESKYVAERMLDLAAQSGVRSSIFRIGQISGPVQTEGRSWNQTEWFPSLVKTSKAMGMLPSTLGAMADVDWIPVDLLTDIIMEIVRNTVTTEWEGGPKVFNLVNPHTAHFGTLAQTIRDQYSINVVPYETWISKLETLEMSPQNLHKYPALKLLDFFQGNTPREGWTKKEVGWDTKQSRRASETMANLKAPSSEDIKIWLRQWAF